MKQSIRGVEITGTTRVVGVIGYPVEHSLSPPMQNAAFAELGLDWVYVPFSVRPDALADAVQAVRALDLQGLNVTIPHKVAVMEHLDELDQSARLIGAVNTVVNRAGRLVGYNTDGAGFLRSLRMDAQTDPKGKNVLMLGAGGAARAIGVQMVLAGAARVDVANRTVERAEDLARHLVRAAGGTAGAYALRQVNAGLLSDYDMLIHTTSWGMAPNDAVPPLLPAEWLHPDLLVCDIVYTPRKTSLLRAAMERGCPVLEGLGMLVHQAALAYELWTGEQAPVAVMYKVLQEKLAQRESDAE